MNKCGAKVIRVPLHDKEEHAKYVINIHIVWAETLEPKWLRTAVVAVVAAADGTHNGCSARDGTTSGAAAPSIIILISLSKSVFENIARGCCC